jgi:spore coat polysaccharide biosynthesis protein SpsF
VWTVNNDPSVRAQAIHDEDIPWELHDRWFNDRLSRQDSRILIGLDQHVPVGVVRFDVLDREAIVAIAVQAEHRGRGIGKGLIRLVTAHALNRPDVAVAVAYVRPENTASQRAFTGCGFSYAREVSIDGKQLLRFEKRLGDAV